MPKRTSRRQSSATRSPARSFKRRRGSSSKRVFRKRRISNVYSFKGIINAGVLSAIPAATSTVLSGQYILKLTDFPIIGSGGGLSNTFNFVRLNKCKMEFCPRYNVNGAPNTAAGTTQGEPVTFLTGISEIPCINGGGAPSTAPTWSSEGGDAGTVTEATAYIDSSVGASYLRGMPGCRETEIYKKHSVWFTPTFYSFLNSEVAGGVVTPQATNPIFEAIKKKWVNLNWLNSSGGTEVQSPGPDFYGPMYAFSNNLPEGGSATAYYDVKLHYSVSFRGLRGEHN